TIVENKYLRLLDECSRNGNALLLATRQGDAALADVGFKALVECYDIMVHGCLLRSILYFTTIGSIEAKSDVVGNGVGKQEYVLWHEADLASVGLQRQLPDVVTIYKDGTILYRKSVV